MAYATEDDYLEWTETTVAPEGIGRLLNVASTRIDEVLVGAVYAVDDDGDPTDTEVQDVLRNAVCEQVFYMLDVGDLTGAGGVVEQTVGRISWKTGAASSGGQRPSRYAPEAVAALQVAGLIPVNVIR